MSIELPRTRRPRRGAQLALTVSLLVGASLNAQAVIFNYVDWTSANVGQGTASGVITLPDASTVNVDFAATNPDGSPGNLNFAQTAGGTNYWVPDTPYLSTEVENAPPDSDIISLVGQFGSSQTYTVTLSEPIKDPIMAIVSLGSPSNSATYDFDAPFEIVSQGTGFWGGTATSLSAGPGDTLTGFEGHGTLKFLGTYSTFSWLITDPENWHGFTFGIRTTERLEPTPDPTPTPNPGVPEPGTLLLLAAGAAAMRLRRF